MRSALMAALLALPVLAQTPDRKSFEVATIKPTEMTNRGFVHLIQGPVVTFQGFSLRLLAEGGLQIPSHRMEWPKDSPDWIRSERFDIVAKAPGETKPSPEDVQAMVRSLLEDRFGMKAHSGSTEIPVYNLVLAEGGPKLKPAASEGPSNVQRNGGPWIFTRASISGLASQGLLGVDRPVFDKTGLTGRYDFVLNVRTSGSEVTGPDGESIFTALREQLGLRLEPGRNVVETLVIDHVERPSSN